jgi:hypothetical protein
MAARSRRTDLGESWGGEHATDVSIPVQTMAASPKKTTPALFNSDRWDIDLKYPG